MSHSLQTVGGLLGEGVQRAAVREGGLSPSIPMALLRAHLGPELSSLFCFVSLCPNPSDGLDKMFLTESEIEFWLPTGSTEPLAQQTGGLGAMLSRWAAQTGLHDPGPL